MKKKSIGFISVLGAVAFLTSCSNSVGPPPIEEDDLSSASEVSSSSKAPTSSAAVTSSATATSSSSVTKLEETSSSSGVSSSSVFEPVNIDCEMSFVGGMLVGSGTGTLTEEKLVFSGKAVTDEAAAAFCVIGVERGEYYKTRPVEAMQVLQRYTTTDIKFTAADTLFLKGATVDVVNGCDDPTKPYAELTITRAIDDEFSLENATQFINAQNERCDAGIELNLSALYNRLKNAVSMDCSRDFGNGLLPVSGKGYVNGNSFVFEATAQTTESTKDFCELGISRAELHKDNPLEAFGTAERYIKGLTFTHADTVFFTGAKIDITDNCENGSSTVKVTRPFDESFGLTESILYINDQKARCEDKNIDLNLAAIAARLQQLGAFDKK